MPGALIVPVVNLQGPHALERCFRFRAHPAALRVIHCQHQSREHHLRAIHLIDDRSLQSVKQILRVGPDHGGAHAGHQHSFVQRRAAGFAECAPQCRPGQQIRQARVARDASDTGLERVRPCHPRLLARIQILLCQLGIPISTPGRQDRKNECNGGSSEHGAPHEGEYSKHSIQAVCAHQPPVPDLALPSPSYYTGLFMQYGAYNSFRFWFWYRT